MNITTACIHVLEQLKESVMQMSNPEYCASVLALNGSTIGQHCRHTIEFFQELRSGYNTGYVNYDQRSRDIQIESDTDTAIKSLSNIINWLEQEIPDRSLSIAVTYDEEGNETEVLNTSFHRELVYNIEHAIHHMALIKVGIKEVCPQITIEPSYGVAVSTLRYERAKGTTLPK